MKKLLVIALVVATVLGTAGVASASFTDVTGPVAEAAEKLADLGIAQGMTATSFGPAQNVTRAQMAAFIVRSLGLEASATASKGATLFTDVAANYWGSGYVNVASSMGIIVGHQGRFRPEDPVKFSEAATMMVRALGYTDAEVAALGAWPTGHIAKATALDLLAGVTAFSKDANANRGNIALLVKNMVFDAPAKADGKTLAVSVFKIFNIASIVVTPATATAAIGELKEFKAVGKDAAGADVALEGVVWSVTGNAIVGQDGKFTAYGSGPCVVKATVGDLSGTAAVHVAGAPSAVKLTLGSTSLTDNGTSTVNLKVNVVDAAGVVVPTGAPTVNLAISGASFRVGSAIHATHALKLKDGEGNIAVVGPNNQAAGAAQITATSSGITGAIASLTLTRPVMTSIALSIAPATIEATGAGSAATITARVLDQHGVNIRAQGALAVTLAVSPTTIGTTPALPLTIADTTPSGTAAFTATAVPGTAAVSSTGLTVGGVANTAIAVTPASVNTAIAGDAYKLAFDKAAYDAIGAGSNLVVRVQLQDFNGVVKTTNTTTTVAVTAKHTDGTTKTASATVTNGVATITFRATEAGEQLLKAGAWALEATSGTFQKAAAAASVNPGAAAVVAVRAASPAVIAANNTQQSKLSAVIEDAHGNVVTTATTELTFKRSSATAAVVLPANLKVTAVNGVAELWVTASSSQAQDTFTVDVPAGSGLTLKTGAVSCTVDTKITGFANKLAVVIPTANVKAGESMTVSVQVQDANGTLVSTDQGRAVSLVVTSANKADITVSGTGLTVDGVATFKLTSTKAISSDIALEATSAGLIKITGLITADFIAGDAAKIKVSSPMAAMETTTTGVTLTLSVVDAYGNARTGDPITGVVLQTTLGSLAGTPNTSFAAGTASGTATITDTDGVGQIGTAPNLVTLPVEGCSITLYNAGPAHRLFIKDIASTVVTATGANGALVTVEVQDSEGKLKTTAVNTIALTLTGGAGTGVFTAAGITTTGQAAVNGSISFRVTNTLVGGVSVKATTAGLVDGAATAAFTVGAPDKITVTAVPTAIKADGSSISQLTARVEDVFGNVVTTFAGTMDWSITAAADFGTLLNATTSIVNGIAYNTLQSRSRDIAGTVTVQAACDIKGDIVKETGTANVTVDGLALVISSASMVKNHATTPTGFIVTFNVNKACTVTLKLQEQLVAGGAWTDVAGVAITTVTYTTPGVNATGNFTHTGAAGRAYRAVVNASDAFFTATEFATAAVTW